MATKSVITKGSSKLSKLADYADGIGVVIGYLGTFATGITAEGFPFFEGLVARHYNAIKYHSIQKLEQIPVRLADPNWGSTTMLGIAMAVIGVVADQIPSMAPLQKPVTRLVKKMGIGITIGGLAALVVSELSQGSGGSVIEGGSRTGTSPRTVTTSGRVTPVLGDWQTISPRTSSLPAPMK